MQSMLQTCRHVHQLRRGEVTTQEHRIIVVEQQLQELVECFEPTSPPTIYQRDGAYVTVSEECEEAIARAERVLGDEEMEMGE